MISEREIESFWQEHPCGEGFAEETETWKNFFQEYDQYRYNSENHILSELDNIDFKGKEVLEVGIGQGADAAQIIKRGGLYYGLDVTDEAIKRARLRFEIFKLNYRELKKASVLQIPYEDRKFDIVFSHGVLHHVPDINRAVGEIRRVIKSDGKLIVMLYNINSLNYIISINIIRRIGMFLLYFLSKLFGRMLKNSKVLSGHINNAEKYGLFNYLKQPLFTYKNTDGPANPYSKVYNRKEMTRDFGFCFDIVDIRPHFLNLRQLFFLKPLPGFIKDYLARKWGWHLWVFLKPKDKA